MKKLHLTTTLLAALISVGSANAGIVYLDSSNGDLWAGDPTGDTYTYIGNSYGAAGSQLTVSAGFQDIGFSSSGVLYGIDANGGLYSINTSTAAASYLGATGLPSNGSVVGVSDAWNGPGPLYVAGNNSAWTINADSSPTATPLSCNSSTCNGYITSGDLEFDGSGNLFLTSVTDGNGGNNSSGDYLWQLNPSTGAGTLLGQFPGFSSVFGMIYDSDDATMYGYTGAFQQFDVNTTTVSLSGDNVNYTLVGGGDPGILYGAAFIASPEPSTIWLGIAGSLLIALGAIRSRKSTNQA